MAEKEKLVRSMFRLVSFGIAAENKAMSTDYLEVTPIEINPFLDGDILANPTDVMDKGADKDGKAYTVKVTTANSIRAKWLQWGSNRATAPDVRRGERILLYQYESTDHYYWVCAGLDDHLRKLETVVYLFSGTTKESDTQRTPLNCYALEVSTHQKEVTFTTSKANGEAFAYTFQFNTGESTVTLADDNGNFIQLDTKERVIHLKNKDGSFIKIDKKSIYISSPDLIDVKTKKIKMKAETMEVDIPTTTWKGNISQTGNYAIKGGLSQSGGNTTTSGNVTASGDVKAGPISLKGHKHTSGQPGSPTSPPI